MDLNMTLYSLILFTSNLLICWCRIIKSSADKFQTPEQASFTDQSNIFRPDLGCILFGAAGCSITCNVMCDMYGCQTYNPICLDEIYCECNEKYEISSSLTATTSDYNSLSFNKLWNYKLNKSKTSKKIRQKIFQDPETFDEILKILRDPHKTGLHVIRRLQDLHPKWTSVSELEPRQLGYINNLIEGEQLNDNELHEYLETNMEPMIEETYDQLQNVELEVRLSDALDQIDREEEIRQIVEQIALLNKSSLNDYTKKHLKQKGLEVDDLAEMLNKENSGLVSVYDADQLILASVLEKLLDIKENNRIVDVKRTAGNKQFALSEEMTVGREDLFDSNFNADEDTGDTKSFILSEEMTVGREDLYDSDFARSIKSSDSESESKKNKRKFKEDKSQKRDRYEINKSNRISDRKIIINNNNNNNNNNDEYYSSDSINNNNNNNDGEYSSYYDDYYTTATDPPYPPPPPPPYSSYYNPAPAYSSYYGDENYRRQGPVQYQMNSNFGGSLPPMPPPPPPPPANICCGGYGNFGPPPPPPPPQSWDANCCDGDRSSWMETFFPW